MYPEEYLIGVLLFNRGDWFESHEAWESLWRGTYGQTRDFYQGLIHVAVGLCHYANGNIRGARKLHGSSAAYLAPFRPTHLGLDLDRFLAALDELFAPILEGDPDRVVTLDESRVPPMVLEPPPTEWPEIPAWIYEPEERDAR